MSSHLGLLCSLEGMDGVGKTSAVNLVANKLRKEVTNLTTSFEPGATQFGQRLRSILFDARAGVKSLHPSVSGSLYLSDHIYHQETKIKPAYAAGHLIIQDRSFIDSQRAYFPEAEQDPCFLAHHILHPDCLRPDLTIVLDLDAEVAFNRVLARGDERFKAKPWSNLDAFVAIKNRYINFAIAEPERMTIVELQESTTPECVADVVAGIIMEKLAEKDYSEEVFDW